MQLMGLMVDGLMPLLDDPSQYDSLMQQLSDLFMPDRQPPVDGAVLSLRYQCVRAAVGSRRLARVVEEVEKLIRACGG
jgi:hypothetical protein